MTIAQGHNYTPRGTAVDVFNSREPELLVSGPAGTGKSRALLEKLFVMCLLNPGMRGLMLRKVLASLGSTGLVTWREHVALEALAAGTVKFYGGSAQASAQYIFKNGSTVTLGGMDKPTKIMSSEYDIVYVQEAIELTETDWESITTRLRNGKVSFQQLMADTNPAEPTHWLYKRCASGRTKMINSRHEDNPILFNEDGSKTEVGEAYIGKLDNLTGVRHKRLRLGQWVAAEGLIYEDFQREIHCRQIVDPPHDWARYWAVDFGFTNPFVLQCWAEDPDGRLYLYRELYHSRRLVEDHAKQILNIVQKKDGSWREPKPRVVICDHDAEDRATLERYLGIGTVAAQKTVSDGIQAVQQRLRVQADGRPRIYFSPSARVELDRDVEDAKKPTSTLEEIPQYVWDIATTGVAAERPPKETPKKENDHGCDAMRYMVAYLDVGPRPRMRWLT